ncbi:MAG TPA: 7-cyano-7-deazaguanine synthase QueC [Gammaproteobacteria bacterium]|nr:7-cyano-7-deazaguanine synthase QueC [Gammaproteobacteria bacterium]
MRSIVLLSGGLDSATVLAQVSGQGDECFALTVDYGQRHAAEIDAARYISSSYRVIEHRIVRVDYGQFGGSALTDKKLNVPTGEESGIPITYVPARNTVMLSIALGWAEVVAAKKIYIGVNAVDYSGYPDCRPAFIEAFNDLACVATKLGVEGSAITVEAPLIKYKKADIIKLGAKLGVNYALTVSCYQADSQGRACANCDACRLRRNGFAAAGLADPTEYLVE